METKTKRSVRMMCFRTPMKGKWSASVTDVVSNNESFHLCGNGLRGHDEVVCGMGKWQDWGLGFAD